MSSSKPSQRQPSRFLIVISGALIVLVSVLVVSDVLEDDGGKAPGLRKFSARPSVLKNAGYVVERTTGHKIERF